MRVPLPSANDIPANIAADMNNKGGALAHLNIFRQWSYAPATIMPNIAIAQAQFNDFKLSARDREIVVVWVAISSRSNYEWAAHKSIALSCGVTEEQMAAVAAKYDFHSSLNATAQPLEQVFVSESDRVLCELLAVLTARSPVTDTLVSQALEYFGAHQLVEIIQVEGYYRTIANLDNVLDVDLEPPVQYSSTYDSVTSG